VAGIPDCSDRALFIPKLLLELLMLDPLPLEDQWAAVNFSKDRDSISCRLQFRWLREA